MKDLLQRVVSITIALVVITFAASQLNLSVLKGVSAHTLDEFDWPNGCCMYTSECGVNMTCYQKPSGWAGCGPPITVECAQSPTGYCVEAQDNYCNGRPLLD